MRVDTAALICIRERDANQSCEFHGTSANSADKSARIASRSHGRIRAASISKYSDNLAEGVAQPPDGGSGATVNISSKIPATHENSKDGIREAAEFAEGAAEKGMGMADMCEKHGALGAASG